MFTVISGQGLTFSGLRGICCHGILDIGVLNPKLHFAFPHADLRVIALLITKPLPINPELLTTPPLPVFDLRFTEWYFALPIRGIMHMCKKNILKTYKIP